MSFVSGITDVHPITLSSLRLFSLGKLEAQSAVISIAFAYIANLGFKLFLVASIGGWHLARHVVIGFVAMAAGVMIGSFLL